MTPRERLALLKLAVHIGEQGEVPREADAERELEAMLKVRSDAAYLLLRRCLTLELALEEAQARLDASQRTLAPFAAGSYAVQGLDECRFPRYGGTRSAVPQAGLRDLLGEWTSTTLLSDLAEDRPPPAKGPGKGWGRDRN